MLKTLGKTTWEEIEVGEVFAWNGCWSILIKNNNQYAGMIATDLHELDLIDEDWDYWYFENGCKDLEGLYKLPQSTQRLWREDYD